MHDVPEPPRGIGFERVAQWEEHGFAVLPGYVPVNELEPAGASSRDVSLRGRVHRRCRRSHENAKIPGRTDLPVSQSCRSRASS